MENKIYCVDPLNYQRYVTREVTIGPLKLGANNPIRVQSMTTADTMETQLSVEESIKMIDAGCEIVRLTAPSKKEAENLAVIKSELEKRGYFTPLVADIHFTPNAAEIAANHVEKIRVNPGNYADKKKFEEIDYTDDSYQKELIRIEEKFTPLVLKCKNLNRAMRIGTNHGSLSDRILSRFGDTPEGMVESALEFIRICEKNEYYNLVISMKASNTLIMVQAYRLLVAKMQELNMNYPLHLGVTEAGDGEDGRVKSAVGIGALLEDGLGDTIRVSLTENPEYEIPVANKLIEKFKYIDSEKIVFEGKLSYNPFEYKRRETHAVQNIGNHHVPIVIADLSDKEKINPANFFGFGYVYSIELDKWNIMDQAADVVYIGNHTIDFEVPGTLSLLQDYSSFIKNPSDKYIPLTSIEEAISYGNKKCFVKINLEEMDEIPFAEIKENWTLVLSTSKNHKTPLFRKFRLILDEKGLRNPVILKTSCSTSDQETFQLHCSSDLGIHLIDGFGDGVWIAGSFPTQFINSLSFGVLQATRTRISKTEYISCPSCGRTLFDLQETTAKIRAKTSHLKGIKIGIMGCIVNGPGEMADADYGYVGTGPGKINLYKEKEVIKRNVNEENAVDALIELIKENGDWIEIKN